MAEYERVAGAGEIPPGEMKIVEVNGQEVVIANLEGEFVCFSNTCTHRHGPLGEGLLLPGGIVECPFHGGHFDVRTGAVKGPPPTEPIPVYPVKLDGDEISVAVEGVAAD